MLGGEVVEGQHCFAILRQAFDRLVVLRPVFLGEDIDRQLGRSSVRGQVNFAQVLLHVHLHRQRDLGVMKQQKGGLALLPTRPALLLNERIRKLG